MDSNNDTINYLPIRPLDGGNSSSSSNPPPLNNDNNQGEGGENSDE